MSEALRRVSAILLRPRGEWARIEAEPATIGGIYRGYALILVAIGPLAEFVGGQISSRGERTLIAAAWALLTYLLALAALHLLALVVNALAPPFGGTKDDLAAFKLAAYSSTAAWLARIVLVVPAPWAAALGLLASLYSFYLLYLGLPRMMRVPDNKVAVFAGTLVGLMLVANVAALMILRLVAAYIPGN